MPITGECFCGEIRYQVDGKSCHCAECRKAFNAQASAVASLNPTEFKWLCGESLLTSYINKDGYGLQFCKTCGSTLTTIHNGKIIQVTLGCVNGEPDIEVSQHIFVGSKANWEIIPDGVVQFEKKSHLTSR